MGRFFKGRDIAGLPPRFFGYCAVDQTRRRFCQRRWPRTPATPPIANRADRIFEALKKCGLNWGVSVLRRAVEKANHRHGWLAARRDRPRRCPADQRDEIAAFPLTEMHPIPSRAGSTSQDTGLQWISQRPAR